MPNGTRLELSPVDANGTYEIKRILLRVYGPDSGEPIYITSKNSSLVGLTLTAKPTFEFGPHDSQVFQTNGKRLSADKLGVELANTAANAFAETIDQLPPGTEQAEKIRSLGVSQGYFYKPEVVSPPGT